MDTSVCAATTAGWRRGQLQAIRSKVKASGNRGTEPSPTLSNLLFISEWAAPGALDVCCRGALIVSVGRERCKADGRVTHRHDHLPVHRCGGFHRPLGEELERDVRSPLPSR